MLIPSNPFVFTLAYSGLPVHSDPKLRSDLMRCAFSHNLPPMAWPTDPTSHFLQQHLGKKVSIRLHDGDAKSDGGHAFRDLLGILVGETSVRRKDGSFVEFDRAKVFAFRIVEEVE